MKKIIIAAVLICGTLLWAFLAQQNLKSQIASGVPQESLLTKLPGARFSTFEGAEFDLHASAKTAGAKVVMVHYWATWCGPCEAELPEMMAMLASLPKSENVFTVLVAVNDDVAKIRKFIDKLKIKDGLKYAWVLDNNSIHRDVYGTTKLPETYLFSSEGKFLRKLLGPQEWQKPMFLDMFALYLP